MSTTPPVRAYGIEFGDVHDRLEAVSFPASKATVVDRCGDCELGLLSGSVSLENALAPLQGEQFASEAEVLEAIFSYVGVQAVGRPQYTDRGGTAIATDGPQVSF